MDEISRLSRDDLVNLIGARSTRHFVSCHDGAKLLSLPRTVIYTLGLILAVAIAGWYFNSYISLGAAYVAGNSAETMVTVSRRNKPMNGYIRFIYESDDGNTFRIEPATFSLMEGERISVVYDRNNPENFIVPERRFLYEFLSVNLYMLLFPVVVAVIYFIRFGRVRLLRRLIEQELYVNVEALPDYDSKTYKGTTFVAQHFALYLRDGNAVIFNDSWKAVAIFKNKEDYIETGRKARIYMFDVENIKSKRYFILEDHERF